MEAIGAIMGAIGTIMSSVGSAYFMWWLTCKRPNPNIKLGDFIQIRKHEVSVSSKKASFFEDNFKVQIGENQTVYQITKLSPKYTIIEDNGRYYKITYGLRLANLTYTTWFEKLFRPGNVAYNIRVFIRICYRNRFFRIKTPEIPILFDKQKKSTARNILFDFSSIPEDKIKSLSEQENGKFVKDKVLEHYNHQKLLFEDFLDDDKVKFEVVVCAYTNEGTAFRKILMDYDSAKLKKYIQEGCYNDDKDPLKFTSFKERGEIEEYGSDN